MTRLPVAAFITFAVATIGAFFVVQHLKVATPLISGFPAPYPAAINPVDGKVCLRRNPKGQVVPVNFKRMSVSFYLLNRADNVDVYILDDNGDPVAELPGSGVYMHIKRRHLFVWNGREDDGSLAPPGRYYIRVALVHQGRDVEVSNPSGPEPVTIITTPPRPRVTGVSPSTLTFGAGANVTITYTGNEGQRPRILLYRVRPAGAPRLVKSFAATSLTGHSVWNGQIGGAPAPRGVYLVALQVTDRACNTGTFPPSLPPTLESASHAEVTIS